MKGKCFVLVIFLQLFSDFEECTASLYSEEFARLPRIFFLNETEECPKHHYYCKINILLKPKNLDNPPEIWKLIDKQSAYRRDKIYRAICSEKKDVEAIEEKIQCELLPYNLTGEVTFSYCDRKMDVIEVVGFYDLLFGLLLASYLGLIAYATIATHNTWKNANHKYLKMFSLINTWKDIETPNRNKDFNNLLCIQSLRTIGMVIIVGLHSLMSLMLGMFIRNPEFFEDAPNNLIFHLFTGSFGVLVQIYFIISSWLLAVQLHNTVRDKGDLTLKDLALLSLNRYIRLLPAVFVNLSLFTSKAVGSVISHPYFYSVMKPEVELCRTDWWKNILFFQNMQSGNERMCQPGMWYIAADFQMYMMISALFYISRKFNISMKYLLILMTASTVSFQLFTDFRTEEFNRITRLTPRLLPPEEALNDPRKMGSYFKTYGSCMTYVIGFVFGTIYFHNKEKTIFNTTMKKLVSNTIFLTLPILCCYVGGIEFNEIVETVKNITLRPLFGLGIAIGILGIATGSGGIMKKFLESKTMVFFGSFTYSIYMFHFCWIYVRTFFFPQYVQVTTHNYVMTFIMDVVASFTFGIIMYIILEHPFVKLQKQLIPQMSRKKKEGEYKKES